MRTVTFADLDLVSLINSSSIPVWNNQNPQASLGFKTGAALQPKPTQQQIAAYPQGGGGGNLRAYFCTPDGKIFHYVQGYWSSEHFGMEIKYALSQFEKIKAGKLKLDRQAILSELKKRSAELEKQRALIKEEHPEEFKKPFAKSETRRRHAALGLKVSTNQLAAQNVGQDIKSVLNQILQQNLQMGIIK